ncbi:MAG: precorrin-6A reductase [Parasporobacterium sp.]|nr:precorrin-6A reductase [Parasporobacterium sp.]
MKKICIFAGTTEGRMLAEFLRGQPVSAVICVATEYGGELVKSGGNLTVLSGRLPVDRMKELFDREAFDLVIDATHPYASSITRSICEVCDSRKIRRLRLLREESGAGQEAVFVRDVKEAVSFLNRTRGNILLTTGSKELREFQEITGFADRVYARVLPLESSLRSCEEAGLQGAHIIAMQGPFSEELNTAMLRQFRISFLVTKDGGSAGGFPEKAEAARKSAVRLVVIGRPLKETGSSYQEVIDLLCREYDCRRVPEVVIAGIGPGSEALLTGEVREAIETAQCLIGAGRMLKSAGREGQPAFEAIAPDAITDYIRTLTQYRRFTVLMSGDTGFFSGTRKLITCLQQSGMDCHTTVLPGISSLSYLCARLQVPYEEVQPVSLHGREGDIAGELKQHDRLFVLVGGSDGINRLCRSLIDAGYGDVRLHVGEHLSYENEKITEGTARELEKESFASLSAALIEKAPQNEELSQPGKAPLKECRETPYGFVVTHGLPDTAFLRGTSEKGIVPMTKSEVRTISISKLQLTGDALCWDVGAGTGSVAIEIARQIPGGFVYAVEKKPEAAELIRFNQAAFALPNLTVVEGTAPEALRSLPAPTHVFIGGSSGDLEQILDLIYSKNPGATVVVTAITLETIGQMNELIHKMKKREPEGSLETEILSVNIAGDRPAGSYHLMTAQNPVFLFTIRRRKG